MTLVEFLLARISEDEARARAAIEDDSGSDEGFSGQYAALIKPPSGVGMAQGGFGEAAARMIATYAVPARVLAECEAKRRIVGRHDGGWRKSHRIPITGREWISDRGCRCGEHWPCPELSALAAVYADHPAYDERWRP